MKCSNYNICLPFEDGHVIFNGITKRFFRVSNHNRDAFLEILSAPDRYKDQYGKFLERMAKEGFIVEDNKDEMDDIKLLFERHNNSNIYKLMILPTYQCNLRCWYCTQEHRRMRLSADDVERIKKHISYYLTHHPIQQLMLSWFGGEPMLEFPIIEEISRHAKKCCKDLSLEFRNTITTNGTLLGRECLEKMRELNFSFFQITVDGAQEEHDQTKVLKGRSSYEIIMKNLCLIAEVLPDAEICLRYNYTLKNLQPEKFVEDLNRSIPPELRGRIHLSLKKVWQEDEMKFNSESIESLRMLLYNSEYAVNENSSFSTCYVDQHHFNCVFPNGRVDKCDNDDPESCRGYINSKGEICWKEEVMYFKNTVLDSQDNVCYQCKLLPLCYGPCPRERDRGKSIQCRYCNPVIHWKEEIARFCRLAK